MRVRAERASIVDPVLKVHAIVNASNPEAALGSGVSGAIATACGGLAFQRVVRAAREEQFDAEPLGPDDCLVTTAGDAVHLRWVLHVPGVDYRHRDPETGGSTGPARIRRCVSAALIAAAELACQHQLTGQLALAMPLLGAGHGGLGAVRAAGAVVHGVRGFIATHPQDAAAIGTLVLVALTSGEVTIVRQALQAPGS